jgi:hypothetical protein
MDKQIAYQLGAQQACVDAGLIKEAAVPGPGRAVGQMEYLLAKLQQMAGTAGYKAKGLGQDIAGGVGRAGSAIGALPGEVMASQPGLAAEWHLKQLLRKLQRGGRAVADSPITVPALAGAGGAGAGYGLSELLGD